MGSIFLTTTTPNSNNQNLLYNDKIYNNTTLEVVVHFGNFYQHEKLYTVEG